MDILYIYRRSTQEELELRYSLRSVARHLPYIRKVWIFGDQPAFLSDDRAIIEHVPQEYTAGIGQYRLPVVNLFLQIFLGSLIPELSQEFLLCADDYVLLDDVPEHSMRKDRALEDLFVSLRQRAGVTAVAPPPRSAWREALWRTADLLMRLDLPVFNFESHIPAFMTKARVLDAFCVFRDFITEDRLYGPLACTAILNLAVKRERSDLVLLGEEKSRAGVYVPTDFSTIQNHCAGKKFLNFDEAGFADSLRRYLDELFPDPSHYEVDESSVCRSNGRTGPSPAKGRSISHRERAGVRVV